jgi:predicted PurR-regulated permease PerM
MENGLQYKIKIALYSSMLVIIFFFVMIAARDILIPLSLGFLFASMIYPLVAFLNKHKVPRPLAILISILLFIGILYLLFNLLFQQMQVFVEDFPMLKQKALSNLEAIRNGIEENFGIASDSQHRWLTERIRFLFDTGSDFMKHAVGATTGTIFKIVIIPVFMFYMLNSRERFRGFVVKIVPSHRKVQAESIMTAISNIIQRYLGGLFIVILILCVLNSVGLYIIGLKYALIFGIISALFNVIPYFGNWIGGILPLTFAFLTGDSPKLFFSVLLLYAIIQFLEHNILTPNITGGNVRINPLVAIVGIIVGGMVWGVAGMLVVIPFLATLKIIFENIGSLKPFAFLLGSDEQKHQILIKKFIKRISRKRTKNES